jgi:hypothetical protein
VTSGAWPSHSVWRSRIKARGAKNWSLALLHGCTALHQAAGAFLASILLPSCPACPDPMMTSTRPSPPTNLIQQQQKCPHKGSAARAALTQPPPCATLAPAPAALDMDDSHRSGPARASSSSMTRRVYTLAGHGLTSASWTVLRKCFENLFLPLHHPLATILPSWHASDLMLRSSRLSCR